MNENVEFQDIDSAESKYGLAEEYARNGEEEKALELLKESADGGYAEAMYAYGVIVWQQWTALTLVLLI